MRLFVYIQKMNKHFMHGKGLVSLVLVLAIVNASARSSSAFVPVGAKTNNMIVGTTLSLMDGTTPLSQRSTNQTSLDGWTLLFDGSFERSTLNTALWNIADSRRDGYQGCCLSAFGSQAFAAQDILLHQGILRIKSEKRSLDGKNYTSGAITTENKFSLLYGRVDISARLPRGQGIWPAFWLLTDNTDHEIDLMEMVNTPTLVYQTSHVDIPDAESSVSQCRIASPDLSTTFHLYSLIWNPTSITWYIDGAQTCQVTTAIPQTPMYLLLNTAVGGDWPGPPDATTVFPQYTDVGYVRVYQQAPSTGCLGLQVTSPLHLQTTSITLGHTLSAAVTYTNRCTLPFELDKLIVAARTPDGDNADFDAASEPMTLQPGQALTLYASRFIKSTDPIGQWYAFSSFQTADGNWHADGTNLVNFAVTD